MNVSDAQGWVVIIVAASGAIVSVITAMNSRAKIQEAVSTTKDTNTRVVEVGQKVDLVHTLTNSNYTEQKQLITQLQAEIKSLAHEAIIAERAREALAVEAAKVIPKTLATIVETQAVKP